MSDGEAEATRCPRCRAPAAEAAAFCEECGARFERVCPSCRAPVGVSARFCRSCGAPLGADDRSPASFTPSHLASKILASRAALEGERKQVTALFADLRGSMELLEGVDPEEARRLMDPAVQIMMDAVHRYEGTVNHVLGDGIMALFGAPIAHEDAPRRALYAALAIRDSVARYGEQARRERGAVIQVRVGVNSGEVVVRAIGSDLHMDYSAIGQTTHLAARMEQLAPPGGIRLTAETVRLAVRQLDRVIDLNFYPIETARRANLRWRPVGLGAMGLQDVFFKLRLPFDSDAARALSRDIAEAIYFHALSASCELAIERGRHPSFNDTRAAGGELQFDAWDAAPAAPERWNALRARIAEHGLRNSLLIAIAPTATIASIAGCCECIEPQVSNLFKRETLSGDFLVVNRYLAEELKALGLWTPEMRDRIKLAEGSIQAIGEIPQTLREIYRTVWEVPMRSLIDMAAERGAFIDQSQSLNLFIESPNIGQLSSMYMYAWKRGLKTTYYLRAMGATHAEKSTTKTGHLNAVPMETEEVKACAIDNPDCEACQ